MCSVNGTIQCALGMDYPMCSGKELANVPCKWDYPMCPENGASQCALGIRLSNVPWEWD